MIAAETFSRMPRCSCSAVRACSLDPPPRGMVQARPAAPPAGRRRRTGRRTFPQVLLDGRPIGGYQELSHAIHAGDLHPSRVSV